MKNNKNVTNFEEYQVEELKRLFYEKTGVEMKEAFKVPTVRVLDEVRMKHVELCHVLLEKLIKAHDSDATVELIVDELGIGLGASVCVIAEWPEFSTKKPFMKKVLEACDSFWCAPADEEGKVNVTFYFDNVYRGYGWKPCE